jgi:SAM-dependent methyltransferase
MLAFDESSFLSTCAPFSTNHQSQTLDLGCGTAPRNPFGAKIVMGIDIRESVAHNVVAADLFQAIIPFESGIFDYVTAYDFIEHIPRSAVTERTRFPFIELMNEIYRVMHDGGIFYSYTPAYPFPEAFTDPTHVNIITEDTFPRYFCSSHGHMPEAYRYGFRGDFELISQQWLGFRLLTALRKKPIQ